LITFLLQGQNCRKKLLEQKWEITISQWIFIFQKHCPFKVAILKWYIIYNMIDKYYGWPLEKPPESVWKRETPFTHGCLRPLLIHFDMCPHDTVYVNIIDDVKEKSNHTHLKHYTRGKENLYITKKKINYRHPIFRLKPVATCFCNQMHFNPFICSLPQPTVHMRVHPEDTNKLEPGFTSQPWQKLVTWLWTSYLIHILGSLISSNIGGENNDI
jgi:hypothetical protein